MCFKTFSIGLSRPGIERYGNHNYYLSWKDPNLVNTQWDWFNGRNFCRKRCMDLVSFETLDEYEHFKDIMTGELNTPVSFFVIKQFDINLILKGSILKTRLYF
jgi:hypothetical protein